MRTPFPSDSDLFKEGVTITDIQAKLRDGSNAPGQRRARLLAELASLSKRFINEKIAFEELLSEKGVQEFSGAVYAMEWAQLYYRAVEREMDRRRRGYWPRLWRALLNK